MFRPRHRGRSFSQPTRTHNFTLAATYTTGGRIWWRNWQISPIIIARDGLPDTIMQNNLHPSVSQQRPNVINSNRGGYAPSRTSEGAASACRTAVPGSGLIWTHRSRKESYDYMGNPRSFHYSKVFRFLPGIAIAGVALGLTAPPQRPPANYDESKVGTYTLPDPLVFNDGQPVRTAADWTKRRRAEILELFAAHVYGRSPQPPKGLSYEIFDVDERALDGKAVRKQVTIYFSSKKDGPKEDLLIYLPAGARKPVPVILSLNFSGNHTATSDPGIKLATVWNPRTHEKQTAPESTRGRSKDPVEKILARGYGFATVCYQDIEPDFKGGYVHGIRPLFFKPGQSEPAPDDWGAIGAWSYGLSRALDYLQKDKAVDPQRVAILGHSRLGKTALWAGALDTRFALVLSSCSGEGGASLARRNYGETLRNLADSFPYWFCANFQKYADHPDQLPVDTHELIALLAPRPVYVTGAEEDRWADPKGEFLACVAASPVYRLLGAQGLGTDQMPPLNQPIMRTIGFHYRTGGHAVTAWDWDQFLTFADRHLHAR